MLDTVQKRLSEFDRMDFVPLGCVKPDFYKGL